MTCGDRPGRVTLYSEIFGTSRQGCKLVQYYGYYMIVEEQSLRYDDDWADHQYFLSAQETAFETALLKRFDRELLISQVSYKQKADIFNHINGYKVPKKQYKPLKEDTVSKNTDTSVRYVACTH